MKNQCHYKLTDFESGTLLDAGEMSYDDYFFHHADKHSGVGMIFDVLKNSYVDEYLSHMLVEHIDSIKPDECTIYIHDQQFPTAGDFPYDSTPLFCIADDGPESLAALKPYLILTITDITEFFGADE